MLKDHVKSAKHRWRDACFLPADITRERFDEMLRTFIEARGSLIERGFVFREILPLKTRSTSMLGAPVHEEIRLFFWRGHALDLDTRSAIDDECLEKLSKIAQRFSSPFVTIDVARTIDEGWAIIETGDAGVSGIPPAISDHDWYRALAHALANES
ncbi:MAG: ATP-grasp domain-containing protein [Polyangiaceae bacterium]